MSASLTLTDADTDHDDGPTPLERWTPDEQLVASVLGSPRASRKMTQLGASDRAWLVAGLTLSGLTAKETAARLSCSLRLVRSIRAEDMTQLCLWVQRQIRMLTDEVRVERVAHAGTRHELARARAEATRLRAQVDQLVAAIKAGEPVDMCGKGHPLVGYNVYRHSGKRFCRTCRREWAAESRVVAGAAV